MLISIITITKEDGALLQRTIDSVRRQRLPDGVGVEHIIINGGAALDRVADMSGCKVYNREPKGIYNAINFGISQSHGDIIGLIHGNDFLADNYVLARVAHAFEDNELDFVYGDVDFVSKDRPGRIFRHYTSGDFEPSQLCKGFSPPHPSLFITRKAMDRVGPYKETYVLGADYELFVRLFLGPQHFKSRHIDGVMVNMERGGISSKFKARLLDITFEKRRSLRENGINVSFLRILARVFFYIRHRKI